MGRRREIERDQRLELAGKKNKRGREEERDVSERIALGQAAQPTSQEAQFDSRLFNQSAGLDSGYHGGADDAGGVYDKPLFADRSQAGIYKFDKDRVEQTEGRMGHIGTKGTKSFGGAGDEEVRSAAERNAPVEFEADDEIEARRARHRERSRSRRRGGGDDEDDFGLDGLLEETKKRR